MVTEIIGRAILLPSNVDTDQIYPGRYLALVDPVEIGTHCLEGVDRRLLEGFRKGDILVVGENFGCGSSREHAPIALLNMGVSAVIGESFARIFFRNAINLGLPLLTCKGIRQEIKKGQRLKIDLARCSITVCENNRVFQCEQIGDQALSILDAGGIKPLMKHRTGA